MRVAVIGGGLSGTRIQRAITERGIECALMSRSTGLDVRDPRDARKLFGYDVVVEAVGGAFLRRRPAVEFFTTSTRMVAQATRESGARHLLLSIVNCELPEVHGYGYFAAKAAQERLAHEISPRLTVVRSTQWFEFASQNQQRMKLGPVCIVPAMKTQPVSLESVARAIAEEALSDHALEKIEIAGPDVMTLQELTVATCPPRPRPLEVRIPTAYGNAFTSGALLPPAGTRLVGPNLGSWIAERKGR